ncbi:MAG: ABC transporter permease, partial [Clostridium sp.]
MRSYKGLVKRYIKNEKRSVVPIFISIILTISLITSVVFIAQNIVGNNFEEKKIAFGDYDVRLQKINSERLAKIKEHENVKEYALGKNNEVLINKSQGETDDTTWLNYMGVYAVEKKFFDDYISFNIIQGRLPENENEIVLNQGTLRALGSTRGPVYNEYGVGKTIEFSKRKFIGENQYEEKSWQIFKQFGEEVASKVELKDRAVQSLINEDIKVEDDEKVTYTIVGIIDTPIGDTLFGDKAIRLLSEEEIADKNNEFEAFTYLKNKSKEEALANDLGIKYIVPTSSMSDPFGYPAADIKYPGYDTKDYEYIFNNGLARTILAVIIVFCFMAVYNTFHASVAKRIKVYGILRALGGTMGQISYLIYAESLLLYAVAAPIGLAIGYGITKLESYILINQIGLLESFTMNFNLEVIGITLISVLLIIIIAVGSVLKKEGKLTPIEAIMDARGLTRKKKFKGSGLLDFSAKDSEVDEQNAIKELIDFDKTTFKFKIMKKLFKYEGELAHKNITVDSKAHKLTKSTLFIAMAILIFFFLQVINGSVISKDIIKSDKWDTEISLGGSGFNNNIINKIKDIKGVEEVYTRGEEKVSLVV